MLPLVSSMTTTVIGRTSLSKSDSSTGFSLSKTAKSSCTRPGTRRRSGSSTVTKSGTVTFGFDRNVGCCGACSAASAVSEAPPHGEPAGVKTDGASAQASAAAVPTANRRRDILRA